MERDLETGHREIEREMGERVYRMLLEAAILETEMGELGGMLQDDPAILNRLMSERRGMDNPLHVGALHGNVSFVREILNKQPKLARELNSEEQSPLHLASARGHVEVVKEILRKDADACFIRDKDGMIPLHLAVINGRVEVLEALVEAEKITAFILTKSGEPILHLCAKNNEFRSLEKLIGLIEKKDRLVSLRDHNDDTILHLLSAMGNAKVIKFLLESTPVDVNAVNKDGFTPLDVLLLRNENIIHEYRIQRLLTEAGAKRDGNNSQFMSLIKKIEIPGTDESGFGEALMVVAILVATVAFQARLSPPGGVWQDNTFNNATLPNATQSSPPPNLVPHYAGKSIMAYVASSSYKEFSTRNDFTLTVSLLVIQLLLASYLFKSRILKMLAVMFTSVSLLGMSFTYYTSATYISLDKQHLLGAVSISSTMLYICLLFWPPLRYLSLISKRK